MAIPYTPALSDLCRTALRRAGQPAPSAGMVEEAMNHAFMEVKNDIKFNTPTHPILMTEEVQVTVLGVRSQAQPTKCNVPVSVLLYDGPAEWRSTATAGASGSITLAASLSEVEANLIGLPIFTLGGTGSLQYRHITAYDNSTKIASVSPAWTTTPSSDTTYVICNYQREMYSTSKQVLNYDAYGFAGDDLPAYGTINGQQLWLNKSPDKIYPLLWNYYIDLDQIDENDAIHGKMLREWRNIVVQGVAAYSMQTYDDSRVNDQFQVYKFMLDRLKSETLTVGQTVPYDPSY